MFDHVFAQSLTLPDGTQVSGPSGLDWADNLGKVVSRGVSFVLAFAGIGLLIMLLASGFEYLTSAGDAKKLEGAKQRLTYSIVGFLLIFTAFWLVQIASRIFGLTEVQNIFK